MCTYVVQVPKQPRILVEHLLLERTEALFVLEAVLVRSGRVVQVLRLGHDDSYVAVITLNLDNNCGGQVEKSVLVQRALL